MLWTIILSGLAMGLITLFVAAPAQAALPPLGESDLRRDATYIVVGEVKSISEHQVAIAKGTNRQFVASVEVIQVEKGLLQSIDPTEVITQPPGTPTPGETIEVHYWQVGERPRGWTGPGGQYYGLPQERQVRLFLEPDQQGDLHLLDPNGWESIPGE
jgi:hypothetical protein